MNDEASDQQIGTALCSAHKQVSLYFKALVEQGADAWQLNAASDTLTLIELIVGKADAL